MQLQMDFSASFECCMCIVFGQFSPEVREDLASINSVRLKLNIKVTALLQSEWQSLQAIEANYCE
ncbi:hypothetical protein BV378_36220 [Nostoc sp. RF31YmG]|nr:hypothetical protein BV378_36220 [Nostoc sp. RF31YmG]OUL21271.1 hypothetical protein BV375_29945 [Nostoc sp. 106C]